MDININFFSTKSSINIYRSGTFEDNIDDENKFAFRGGFDIVDNDKEVRVAEVMGIFFDKDKILNHGENVVEVADMFSEDALRAIKHLVGSGEYDKLADDNMMMLPLHVFYMETFFVYPDYRHMSEYIINNLADFFQYSYNINLHCTVFHPKPEYPAYKGPVLSTWKHLPDDNGTFKEETIRMLSRCGFKILSDSEFYYINYAV